MPDPLQTLLNDAYHADQVEHDRGKAISQLRKKLKGDLRSAAEAERDRLMAVVRAREYPGVRCGCHVSKVLGDLLSEALQ